MIDLNDLPKINVTGITTVSQMSRLLEQDGIEGDRYIMAEYLISKIGLMRDRPYEDVQFFINGAIGVFKDQGLDGIPFLEEVWEMEDRGGDRASSH